MGIQKNIKKGLKISLIFNIRLIFLKVNKIQKRNIMKKLINKCKILLNKKKRRNKRNKKSKFLENQKLIKKYKKMTKNNKLSPFVEKGDGGDYLKDYELHDDIEKNTDLKEIENLDFNKELNEYENFNTNLKKGKLINEVITYFSKYLKNREHEDFYKIPEKPNPMEIKKLEYKKQIVPSINLKETQIALFEKEFFNTLLKKSEEDETTIISSTYKSPEILDEILSKILKNKYDYRLEK